jgi:hypothetical protein
MRWSRASWRGTAVVEKPGIGIMWPRILVVATKDSTEASYVPISGTFSVRNWDSVLDFGNTTPKRYRTFALREIRKLADVARAVAATSSGQGEENLDFGRRRIAVLVRMCTWCFGGCYMICSHDSHF